MEDLTRLGVFLPRFIWALLMAIICGGLIGLERSIRCENIPLRSFVLVCLGATLFMMTGELITIGLGETGSIDIGQIAAIVSLSSALISVAIILRNRTVNSNIGIAIVFWLTAAIGVVIGIGYPLLGLMLTGMILLVLTLISGIEAKLALKPQSILIKIIAREDNFELRTRLQSILEQQGVHPDSMRAEPIPNGVKITISAELGPANVKSLITALWTTPGIVEVER